MLPAPQTPVLRPVAVSAVLESPVVRGERPHLGWVDIAQLRVDDRYQRPLAAHNWRAIAAIARKFDWAKFSVVDVAPVGAGLFAIVDGQHRVHAALMAGIDKVPVRIVDKQVEGQAQVFMGVNGNVTAITPFHVLRASLAAGEPWAVEADRAISRAGCRLMVTNVSAAEKKPGEIYAVQWVRGLASRDGEVNLAALKTLQVSLSALLASREGGANPAAWTHIALRAWHGAVDGLDDWVEHANARRALAGFLDRESLLGMLAAAEDRRRRARREGKPSAAVHQLLMGDLQVRLDAAFPSKAAFVRMGEMQL